MEILVVHGWLHTTRMFEDRYKDLGNVTLFEIDGLDNNRDSDYATNLHKLHNLLHNNKYDLIVGHSMGASLIIDSMDLIGDTELVLFSPFRANLRQPYKTLLPLVRLFPVLKLVNSKSKYLYKLLLGEDCSDTVTEGYRICNATTASRLLLEASKRDLSNYGTYSNKVHVCYGHKDKLVKDDFDRIFKVFPNSYCYFANCGHLTPMHFNIMKTQKNTITCKPCN